jgi:hypothetical protein
MYIPVAVRNQGKSIEACLTKPLIWLIHFYNILFARENIGNKKLFFVTVVVNNASEVQFLKHPCIKASYIEIFIRKITLAEIKNDMACSFINAIQFDIAYRGND